MYIVFCSCSTEQHGVGSIVGPSFQNFVSDCVPHNGRIIELCLKNHGPDIRIVNHYAPHSARPTAEKDSHWNLLHQITQTQRLHVPTIVLGDANARLHGRLNEIEKSVVGPHVFGFGNDFIDSLPEDQKENRQFLVDYCIANEFIVTNIFFPKNEAYKCTYKDARTEGFQSPWSPDRFAQLDFVLTPKKWKNIIRNVHSHTNIDIDSDHAIVTADIQIKLEAQNQPHDFRCRYSRFHKPTPDQIVTCNNYIEGKFVFDDNSLESNFS